MDVSEKNTDGSTALEEAFYCSSESYSKDAREIAKYILQVDTRMKKGRTYELYVHPIFGAEGDIAQLELLNLLLSRPGVDINETAEDGATLLHRLSAFRYINSATLLIHRVASLGNDHNNRSPAHYLADKRKGLLGDEEQDEEDDEHKGDKFENEHLT